MIDIRYVSIRSMDVSNGEGIGVALFVQGCKFHCYNCFNPETWDFNGGKEWTSETQNKFIELVNRTYIKRISILGGDPLMEENLDDVLNLINKIRLSFPQKSIWIYSGYTFDEIFINNKESNLKRQSIIKKCDVLVDGRYIDSKKDINLKWCGSSNQRVIDIQETIRKGNIELYKI